MGASESVVSDSRKSQIFILTIDLDLKHPSSPKELAENLIRFDPSIPQMRSIVSIGSPVILISRTLESSEKMRSVFKELIHILFTPLALSQALAAFKDAQVPSSLEAYLGTCAFFVWETPEDLKALVDDKFKKITVPSTFSIPHGQTKLKTLISDAAKTRGLTVAINERDF
jgi:hypothetical protein